MLLVVYTSVSGAGSCPGVLLSATLTINERLRRHVRCAGLQELTLGFGSWIGQGVLADKPHSGTEQQCESQKDRCPLGNSALHTASDYS